MNTRYPDSSNKPDVVVNVACFISSFIWGMLVAALMYAQALYFIIVVGIYSSIFIFSRSARIRHGVAWSLFGVVFWYSFYWCVMLGGEFHEKAPTATQQGAAPDRCSPLVPCSLAKAYKLGRCAAERGLGRLRQK